MTFGTFMSLCDARPKLQLAGLLIFDIDCPARAYGALAQAHKAVASAIVGALLRQLQLLRPGLRLRHPGAVLDLLRITVEDPLLYGVNSPRQFSHVIKACAFSTCFSGGRKFCVLTIGQTVKDYVKCAGSRGTTAY